jgi:hypothetical protein
MDEKRRTSEIKSYGINMSKEFIDKDRTSKIKDYYKSCQLWIPDKSQWRSWKMKLIDGTYKRFNIKNEKELRAILTRYTPLRAYYSSIAIYNMRNVKGKSKNIQITIFKDSIIDLDNKDFNECRKSAIEVIEKLGIAPDYILKTFKGIHLCYFKKEIDCNLIKEIKDFDIKTFENTYNEFSCPLTLNKGKVCTFLTYQQLLDGNVEQETIYDYLDIDSTSESPKDNDQVGNHIRSEIDFERNQSKFNGSLRMQPEDSISSLLSFNNIVKSGKHPLFVPILIYNKDFKGLKKELDYLTRQYNLGDLCVLEKENNICFISLSVMDEKRLTKLLNNSNSLNKMQQKKFHKIWLNYEEWTPIARIEYPITKFFRASKKHHNALLNLGFQPSKQVNEFVGNDKLMIYEVGIK